MLLQIVRHHTTDSNTIGTLKIDGEVECFTLEDTYRPTKVYGKTRIPEGSYEVTLRTEGSMNKKYSERYDNHIGMLWLRDVYDFEYVYIHVGNNEDDTHGCVLVGTNWNLRSGDISGSALAYQALYNKVIAAISMGYPVNIEVF